MRATRRKSRRPCRPTERTRVQAASFNSIASRALFHSHGRSSRRRLIFVPPDTMRSRTSVRYSCGSISLSLQVYAARRTMPNGSGMTRRCDAGIGHRVYGCLGSIRHSLTAQSASRKASRRSFGWKRVGLPRSYGLSFARAASLSARWACR